MLLPAVGLNDQQVEVLWSRDRTELLKCGAKVESLSGRKIEEGN
ncbi:MAG: hypothetical protein AB3N12_01410 [Ruegeria sp.]